MTNFNIIQVSLELMGAVFCGICIFIIYVSEKEKRPTEKLLIVIMLLNMMNLIMDATAYCCRGVVSPSAIVGTRVSNFLTFFGQGLLSCCISKYFYIVIKEYNKTISERFVFFVYIIQFFSLSGLIMTQFNHFYYDFDSFNRYYRKPGIAFLFAVQILSMLVCIYIVIRYYKDIAIMEAVALVCYVLFPVIFGVIQIFNYGISYMQLGTTTGIVMMYIVHEYNNVKEKNRKKLEVAKLRVELAEKEVKLAESNARIILSQIQPHFLYNALGAIRFLCMEDAEKAAEAIEHFSGYLRLNLEALRKQEMIPFKKEMDHVKEYLWLEQMRFSDKLKIVCDLKVTEFDIPALTVQPLVENSVKHGIIKKKEGGTVIVSTEEDSNNYIIIVKDDGVGFDKNKIIDDGREHIGMENVKDRLQIMCGGTLVVDSIEGKGTTTFIYIPKQN